jgi:hypothetical protein
MLDIGDQTNTFDTVWSCLEQRVALTEEILAQHAKRGEMEGTSHERRRHKRFHFWGRAILVARESCCACYTLNLSQSGIRVLSPKQLFPAQRVRLIVENGRAFELSVCRCQRLMDHCYECGTKFVASIK